MPLQSGAMGFESTAMRSTESATRSERALAITPRLLNRRQAAEYLGCSFWTARDYVLQGLIPVVDLPPLRARDGDRQRRTLRRVLDRADLDAFIESRKRREGIAIG
jgi:hypothetical protein